MNFASHRHSVAFISLSLSPPCTELTSASFSPSSFLDDTSEWMGKTTIIKTTTSSSAFTVVFPCGSRPGCASSSRCVWQSHRTGGWVCVEAAETLLPRRIRWTPLSIPRIPASVGRRPVSRRVLRACSRLCMRRAGARTARATTQEGRRGRCGILFFSTGSKSLLPRNILWHPVLKSSFFALVKRHGKFGTEQFNYLILPYTLRTFQNKQIAVHSDVRYFMTDRVWNIKKMVFASLITSVCQSET